MKYISVAKISYDTAARAVELAMEVGPRHGIRPVAAVADPSMTLVAYGVSDGSTPHSAETSTRKARTSASTGKPTGAIPEPLATALPLGTGGTLTRIDGGLPILFDGVHVGGLGIAGGPPATDREVALEVLELLGADRIEA
ncbi:heme-binding protein [Leucobacter soli]|uniref:Heme-binding protein n=1 Tax=Leucobacter soli TaxID=2812850 RepID=A0A916K2X4_9MICO|nr:heme-binding protein [Leucobacter soli]CAG7622062.1 hypothetical protein LEUCIP111803_02475 [Leucobacter soli]